MSILQERPAAAGSADLVGERPSPSPAPPEIDLRTCAPEKLSAWLLAHRFQENAVGVASFLIECTSTLPDAEAISAKLLGGGGDGEDEEEDKDTEGGQTDDAVKGKKDDGQESKPAATAKLSLLQSMVDSQPHPTWARSNNNEVEVSCTAPRGRFLLSAYNSGIVLINPKNPDHEREKIAILSRNVQHVIWFRKPEDYKKMKQQSKNSGGGGKGKKKGSKDGGAPGHMVMICLKKLKGASVTLFRDKPLGQVCFQLPSYLPPPSVRDKSGDDENENNVEKELSEEYWWSVLESALLSTSGTENMIRVYSAMEGLPCEKGKGRAYVFRSEGNSGSTTTTEGMPYVGCYCGFSDGALFPLREGLLFFKPPLFVPRSMLASISCGRGSGGLSRYVDMVVQLDAKEQEGTEKKKTEDTLEFTNIHRDELAVLNEYIHETLIPAMRSDTAAADAAAKPINLDGEDNGKEGEKEVVAEVVDASDDGDVDDDKRDDHGDKEEGGSRKCMPSRAASRLSREATRAALRATLAGHGDGGDDDDSDEFEEGDAEEDSCDGLDGSNDDEVSYDDSWEDEEFEEEAGEKDDDSEADGSNCGEQRRCKKARVESIFKGDR